MWQKEYETGKTWQNALKYCEDLTYAGYNDWRLPNKNELATLLNYDKTAAPYSDFPDMPSNYFWASTTATNVATSAYMAGFSLGGQLGSTPKSNEHYVRCVRNAE